MARPTALRLLPAGAQHWPVLRALTQLALHADAGSPRGWLALRSDPSGREYPIAAAVLRVLGQDAAAWVAVAEPWRRQGAGRQLWQACADQAAAQGAVRLTNWQGLSEAPGLDFCAAMGLRLVNTLDYFEATLSDAERFFGAFHQRLFARGSVPTDLQVLHGDAVPWHHFAPLMAQEFGPAMAARLGRIAGFGLSPHEWASALMHQGNPVALTLCSVLDDCVSHDAYLVMPAYRRGWAHIACKYLAARDLRQHYPGVERYVFSSADRHGDTRKAAQRSAQRGMATRRIRQAQWLELDLGQRSG